MFNFLNPIKLYIYAAGGAIVAALYGIWKYRGFKISNLEGELATMEKELVARSESHKNELKVKEYEAANKEAAKNAKEPIVDYTAKGEVHAKDAANTFYDI